MLESIHSLRVPLINWNKLSADCVHSSRPLVLKCSRTEYTLSRKNRIHLEINTCGLSKANGFLGRSNLSCSVDGNLVKVWICLLFLCLCGLSGV